MGKALRELEGVISCDEGLLESARLFPELGYATGADASLVMLNALYSTA